VRYVDGIRAISAQGLVQSAYAPAYGNLPAGNYATINVYGLHMACFTSQPGVASVAVVGTWGDRTTTAGVRAP
jgi:hypothetical protein